MKKMWGVLAFLALLINAAILVLCLVKGECSGMVECVNGSVPMKCHWAYRAAALIAGVGVVISLFALGQKQKGGRVLANLANVVVSAAVLLALFVVIGVCNNAEMVCVANRTLIAILAAVGGVISLISLAFANSEKANLPKAKI